MSSDRKKHSIKFRINLFYGIVMSILAVITVITTVLAGRTTQYSNVRQNLIKDVERNISEVEIKNGELDIKSGFTFRNSSSRFLIFSADGKKTDGLYPEKLQDTSIPFEDEKITKYKAEGKTFFLYDRKVEFERFEIMLDGNAGTLISVKCESPKSYQNGNPNLGKKGENCLLTVNQAYENAIKQLGLENNGASLVDSQWYDYFGTPVYELDIYTEKSLYDSIWIRGVALTDDVNTVLNTVSLIMICLLPAFILFACYLGTVISKREMCPIEQLSNAVSEISTANDLTRTVSIKTGDRELISLADNFNSMFRRLCTSFESEKQFSSDASHELRTPVAVIISECELIKEKGCDSETEKRIDSVLNQAEYMKSLISTLLFSTKIEQGKEHFLFENHNLSVLAEQCTDNCRLVYGNTNIVTDIQQEIYYNMDLSLIYSLIQNLLTNAVKYGKPDGEIKLTLRKTDNEIVLSVQNEGIGIKPEDREKIFSRFYRVDKSRSRSEGSYGLGLSISRQIVNLHGGVIEADGKYGKNCIFTVKFFCEP